MDFCGFLKFTMVCSVFFAHPFALKPGKPTRNHGGLLRGCTWMGLINIQWRHREKRLGNFREVGFPNGSLLDFKIFKWI